MIAVKEATQRAAEYCQQFYPDAQDILLEEVERDEDKFWLITLSFLSEVTKRVYVGTETVIQQLGHIFPRTERRFKTLKIDAQTGEFVSMKIRELQI